MADLKMSESEEMYLITLAKLAERGVEGPVPLSRLAEELAVVPVSANQMIHKLEEEGTVEYFPYKGVALRPQGMRQAKRTLRRRRLWEFFLVDRLGMGFEEADALACRLEHLGNDEVCERLSAFLDHPQRSPQGLPIPPADETNQLDNEKPLSRVEAGRKVVVSRIGDEPLREFLAVQAIREECEAQVLARSSHGDVLLEAQGARLHLASQAAEQVFVREISV